MTLESEPFSYRETANGRVMIDWNGRRATVLTGAGAARFLAAVDGADAHRRQIEMARVAGTSAGSELREDRSKSGRPVRCMNERAASPGRRPNRKIGDQMSASVLYMSMSLDGFIAGPNETPDNGLGDGGERLHEWVIPLPDGGVNREIHDEFMSTGAVVAGRGTFEPAGGWGGDHHDGVPIFILSRGPAPAWAEDWPLVHYVDDLGVAMEQAKRAAGDADVLVHGAGIARRALAAGLLDEISIHLVPVLFGGGRSLFEGIGAEQVELERVRVREGESGVTHLRYAIVR